MGALIFPFIFFFFSFFVLCFGLSVLKSVRWAGDIKGRARCSCVAAGRAAPLQRSDCDPGLRVCVCVCFHSLCTHSQRCFCSSPLFSSLFLPPFPSCVSYRTGPQILKIAPGLFGLSPSLSLSFFRLRFMQCISPDFLSSHLLFFFSCIYLQQVLSLLRSIQFIFTFFFFLLEGPGADVRGAGGFLKLKC